MTQALSSISIPPDPSSSLHFRGEKEKKKGGGGMSQECTAYHLSHNLSQQTTNLVLFQDSL